MSSESLKEVGYQDGTPEIEFTTAACISTSTCPNGFMKELMAAESKGAFFHCQIRGQFRYARVWAACRPSLQKGWERGGASGDVLRRRLRKAGPLDTTSAWDGRGYPRSLSGEEIPLAARIVAVADAYISMLSPRAYRTPFGAVNAMKEIRRHSGRQFDPRIVNAFLDLVSDRWLDEIIGAPTELPALAANDDA